MGASHSDSAPPQVTDIAGTAAGTTPRSAMKSRFGRDSSSSLDVRDIVGGRFRTTRQVNPLSPRYTLRVHSSLAMTADHRDPATAGGQQTDSDHLPHQPARPETVAGFHAVADLSAGLRGDTRKVAVVSFGEVERSHPGWRPVWKKTDLEKDSSLRLTDVPGTQILPTNAFRVNCGGVWRKSARPREQVRRPRPFS